ncbi:NADP-dependent oxidoreductase domain-containing protein [Phlebopus sp. FC_14]|nr:NADP-dependent oxidoreductase domain-containing protein [Phlebopus sp. FC_14]
MADVPREVVLNTGYSMPTIGLGVYENPECADACEVALKAGYKMIDSARYYENEAQVGEGVRKASIPREEVFITSKIYHPDFGYDHTLRSVKESVEKLGFGYYDLYLIHSPHGGKTIRLDTYKALLDAKAAGLIRSVGVSNYGEKHIVEIEEAGLDLPAVNQVELHPFCQQRPIVAYCQAKGIVVQAYSPLVRGTEGKGIDHKVVAQIATKHAKSPAQILIRWSLQKGLVPLPKSNTRSRILSNFEVFDFKLDKEDMAALDALDEGGSGAITWNPVDVA